MYYRRKILLALLQHFENGLEKIRLQKLLFLFAQGQKESAYDFVPYKFGCFSFQANADLGTMAKTGLIGAEEKKWVKRDPFDYLNVLKVTDRRLLQAVLRLYGEMPADALIELTYRKYPYFAVNSTIAAERLSPAEYEKVRAAKPIATETRLFTIGYEGSSLEAYLNLLIGNDVKLLCDVRRNPFSMKYGFSKNQLQQACEGVGIDYLHLPEVGIASEWRQQLENQQDYDRLFQRYREECLPATLPAQQRILGLLALHGRVALTCFEADVCQCHRKHLAEAVARLGEFAWPMQHL